MAPTTIRTKPVVTAIATLVSIDKRTIFPPIPSNLLWRQPHQGDFFAGTAGALTLTSTFLVPPPLPPKNWPPNMKSATAATITKITNMATTAALLPPPLLSAIEIHPPFCITHNSHLIGDVSV
jgi:hypothetical protein